MFRLSWVFGPGKQNFIYKLSQWAANSPVLKISADETSVPTYTFDIVDATIRALDSGLTGLYHLTHSGYASRYELARFFLKQIGHDKLVVPVPMSAFPAKAKRAGFTAMSSDKFCGELGFQMSPWEEAVIRYIRTLDLYAFR